MLVNNTCRCSPLVFLASAGCTAVGAVPAPALTEMGCCVLVGMVMAELEGVVNLQSKQSALSWKASQACNQGGACRPGCGAQRLTGSSSQLTRQMRKTLKHGHTWKPSGVREGRLSTDCSRARSS